VVRKIRLKLAASLVERVSPLAASPMDSGTRCRGLFPQTFASAFTLLEVMIAVAFIGIAMLALLSLHHSGMQSVGRARELTEASMLAQALMADAEQARFPDPGRLSGDFERLYPGLYRNFRWQRTVEQSPKFPDVRRVRVEVFYGARFRRRFVLSEFIHNPLPQLQLPNAMAAQQQNTPPNVGGGSQ
jgi:type II secretion system protein I